MSFRSIVKVNKKRASLLLAPVVKNHWVQATPFTQFTYLWDQNDIVGDPLNGYYFLHDYSTVIPLDDIAESVAGVDPEKRESSTLAIPSQTLDFEFMLKASHNMHYFRAFLIRRNDLSSSVIDPRMLFNSLVQNSIFEGDLSFCIAPHMYKDERVGLTNGSGAYPKLAYDGNFSVLKEWSWTFHDKSTHSQVYVPISYEDVNGTTRDINTSLVEIEPFEPVFKKFKIPKHVVAFDPNDSTGTSGWGKMWFCILTDCSSESNDFRFRWLRKTLWYEP